MRPNLVAFMFVAFATAFATSLASADGPENEEVRDLVQLVDRSNLIFVGQAEKVIHRTVLVMRTLPARIDARRVRVY